MVWQMQAVSEVLNLEPKEVAVAAVYSTPPLSLSPNKILRLRLEKVIILHFSLKKPRRRLLLRNRAYFRTQ